MNSLIPDEISRSHFPPRFMKKLEHSWKALVYDGVSLYVSLLSSFMSRLFIPLGELKMLPGLIVLYSLSPRIRCLCTDQVSMQTDFSSSWAPEYSERFSVSQQHEQINSLCKYYRITMGYILNVKCFIGAICICKIFILRNVITLHKKVSFANIC